MDLNDEGFVYLEADGEIYRRLKFKYSPLGRFYRWKFAHQMQAHKRFVIRGIVGGVAAGAGLVFFLRMLGSYPLLTLIIVVIVAMLHKRGVINVRLWGRRILGRSVLSQVS